VLTYDQPYEKTIPKGATWLYLNKLPRDITDAEIQAFMYERGLDLPLENISVRAYPNGSSAKIAVSNEVVSTLVNWALSSDPYIREGFKVEAKVNVGQHPRVIETRSRF
jgi:hypothetical protein